MATKDWKLIGHSLGMNHDVSAWWNENKKIEISTRKGYNNVIVSKGSKNILEKKFNFEYEKLNFIKSYMRSH